MKVFDRQFNNLDAAHLHDLQTLESEGAVYSQFYREEFNTFRFCRIRLHPPEIVGYVDAAAGYDEFLGRLGLVGGPDAALAALSDRRFIERVREYNRWTVTNGQPDTQFCFAAFLGDHLADLVCGGQPGRYEYLSESYTDDRRYLLTEILETFPNSARYLAGRGNSPFLLEQEKDVQDLLYAIIKTVFPDARVEEYTRKLAGGAKRIDIVIPYISTVIEVKLVRNKKHANGVADELRIDIESYHVHAYCKTLIAYVWDPNHLIEDQENFISDLRGIRIKGDSIFKVQVIIKP